MEILTPDHNAIRFQLQSDCENCFGLCCAAMYFSASEGFPMDKEAGSPCTLLQTDFRCSIHNDLDKKGCKGCIAFECLGAGQKVAQVTFQGKDWKKNPESAQQMFEVFLIMRQLHEFLWYLTEAMTLPPAYSVRGELAKLLEEIEELSRLAPAALTKLDLNVLRANVNPLLLKASELARNEACQSEKTSSKSKKAPFKRLDLSGTDLRKKDLRNANFRGACLIAADLRDSDLSGADFIGADIRDTDLSGADISKSIFLIQAQLNTARGNTDTKLPPFLHRPLHWRK